MTVDTLKAALQAVHIEQEWQTCLEAFENATSEQRASLLGKMRHIRDTVLSHAEDIDDPEELTISVALRFIALKSKWQMLNTQINYQMFRRGEADEYLTFQASLLSVLVDAMSKLLTDEDIAKIQEFLLNPVATHVA